MRLSIGTFIIAMTLSGALLALATADPPEATAVDSAATAPSPVDPVANMEDDPAGWGKAIYDAVKSGRYWYAVGAFLICLTWAFRKLVAKRVAWFASDRGGVAAAGIGAGLLLFGTALMATEAPSLKLAWGCLGGMVAAMGGYVGLKKLIWPRKLE